MKQFCEYLQNITMETYIILHSDVHVYMSTDRPVSSLLAFISVAEEGQVEELALINVI